MPVPPNFTTSIRKCIPTVGPTCHTYVVHVKWEGLLGRGHNEKYHCCRKHPKVTVLDESQYGESNGGDRFSIG